MKASCEEGRCGEGGVRGRHVKREGGVYLQRAREGSVGREV